MSHKPGRNVTQAGPKCHTRAKMSHSHVIMADQAPMNTLKANNGLQATGVSDTIFFSFK